MLFGNLLRIESVDLVLGIEVGLEEEKEVGRWMGCGDEEVEVVREVYIVVF